VNGEPPVEAAELALGGVDDDVGAPDRDALVGLLQAHVHALVGAELRRDEGEVIVVGQPQVAVVGTDVLHRLALDIVLDRRVRLLDDAHRADARRVVAGAVRRRVAAGARRGEHGQSDQNRSTSTDRSSKNHGGTLLSGCSSLSTRCAVLKRRRMTGRAQGSRSDVVSEREFRDASGAIANTLLMS
jgi:hypothetical protein